MDDPKTFFSPSSSINEGKTEEDRSIYYSSDPEQSMSNIAWRNKNNKWSDLPRRLVTICLGVPILWMLWCLHHHLRLLFFQVTHVLIAIEWSRMTTTTSLGSAAFFPILSLLLANLENAHVFATVLVVSIAAVTISSPAQSIRILQGIVLISLPFRSWLAVAGDTKYGFLRTISLLLTVWNCDTGALIVGRLCGGRVSLINHNFRQSLRRISPKKSVEGLLGGLLFGCGTYMVLPSLWKWLAQMGVTFGAGTPMRVVGTGQKLESDVYIGLLLSLAAILGDLWESALKRQYQVKDTSKLLPGHGGILDRFDSSLIAVMVYQVYLQRTPNSLRGY